jgi:hypothetical protein
MLTPKIVVGVAITTHSSKHTGADKAWEVLPAPKCEQVACGNRHGAVTMFARSGSLRVRLNGAGTRFATGRCPNSGNVPKPWIPLAKELLHPSAFREIRRECRERLLSVSS